MTLGERIRELRKKSGLSQEVLADKLNVSRQSIQKWEADVNVPSLEAIKCMACFFNVDIDYLVNGEALRISNDDKEDSKIKYKKPGKLAVLLIILLCVSIFLVGFYFIYISLISPYTFIGEHGERITGLMAYIYGADADKTPIVIFAFAIATSLSTIILFIFWLIKRRKEKCLI